MLTPLRVRADDGQLMLLVIGYTFIAAVLVVAGIDVSKVFLARRALSSVADSAALAAAQSLDRPALYAGQGGCGDLLPLDPTSAQADVAKTLADDATDLQRMFADLAPADVAITSNTVTVHLSGEVHVPFGSVLSLLHVGAAGGAVQVGVSSSAQSPVTAPDGC